MATTESPNSDKVHGRWPRNVAQGLDRVGKRELASSPAIALLYGAQTHTDVMFTVQLVAHHSGITPMLQEARGYRLLPIQRAEAAQHRRSIGCVDETGGALGSFHPFASHLRKRFNSFGQVGFN